MSKVIERKNYRLIPLWTSYPTGFYPFYTRDSLHYTNTGTERKSSTWANTMTGRKDVYALKTWRAILHFVPIVSIPYFARLSKDNILKGLNLSNEAYSTTGIYSGSLLRLDRNRPRVSYLLTFFLVGMADSLLPRTVLSLSWFTTSSIFSFSFGLAFNTRTVPSKERRN